MKRKIIALSLISALSVSLLACAAKEDDTSSGEELSPITFTFYNADGSEDPWTDPVALAITEATGVTLESEYPSGQGNDVALMVATQEYPDIIFAKGDANILIDNDALIDLSDLIDEYGPHIKELYGDSYDDLRYSEEDPSIYQLCCSLVQDTDYETSGTAQLQWDVIAYNDYEIPTTLDEYTQMIKNYMSLYPTIDGEKTIGLSISVSDWHWYTTLSNPAGYIANGAVDNGQWIVNEDYSVTYKHAAEGQKEYFAWLNEMYHEGILDPDFATQTHEDYIAKIASGRVLGLLDASWDYATAESSLKAAGEEERTYCGLPVTIDASVTCPSLAQQNLAVGWGIGISKTCEDPVRAIQFIDFLCSEEGQILTHWGIEGVNYYYDENGVRCRTAEEITAANTDTTYEETTGVGLHTYPFPSYGNLAVDSTGNPYTRESAADVIASYDEEEQKALEIWDIDMLIDIFPQADEFEEFEYSPLWAMILPKEIDTLESALDAVAWPGLIDCILCDPEEFDARWDQLQSDLIDAGRLEAETLMTRFVQNQVSYRESMD